ncbi:hypothetical protein DACRYDRAFT_116094 [Dacryopinax primogenitus]|uniref:JmjC domain-containing protein n=1 Tax=Dacryopinax primogenitus (strain DJM 731) TaxID=1858805 RepID=M5G941_DACPD|nr:uncharacterized protein DACRYDRAFT_116094 [Dacryopinax primogenitus]EJU02392.1 hypothetical protein DACRYDRAFT_116094 [Dacryopinax primogenitus]
MTGSLSSRPPPTTPLPLIQLVNTVAKSPAFAEPQRSTTYGPPLHPDALSANQIDNLSGLLAVPTPSVQRFDTQTPVTMAESLAGSGQSTIRPQAGKRAAEENGENEDSQERAAKRPRIPTSSTWSRSVVDSSLPGFGTQTPDTFNVRLPGGLVRYMKLPPERPFSTERDKLTTLGRISRPSSADQFFARLNWREVNTDEGKRALQQRVATGFMQVIHGYKDEYGICSWDELAKLGAPTDVLITKYPFHSVGKLTMDHKVTLRELHKLGAEGSLQWGSTNIPFQTEKPPLLDFLADDWTAWNLGSSQLQRPPHARPQSFTAFNTHRLIQRDAFTSLQVTGRTAVQVQRCGHRVIFYCRQKKFDLSIDEVEALCTMEDYERLGSWYVLVVRPGDLLIVPPGLRSATHTPENNILRSSELLLFSGIKEYERHLRAAVSKELWSAEFGGMAALRTVYRLVILWQHTRPEFDLPRAQFLAMSRLVLRPVDYLPPPKTDAERRIQSLFLRLLVSLTKLEQVDIKGRAGVKVLDGVLREEMADYALAATGVRKAMVRLGVSEDGL